MAKKEQPEEKRSQTTSRKQGHVELCVTGDVQFRTRATGFEHFHFLHNALPELTLEEISLATTLLGVPIQAPLLISSMTGGYAEATTINGALARAAKYFGLAIGIGSARQAMESSEYHESFRIVRREAPDTFVFSNIGAHEIAQLHRQQAIDSLQRIIDLVEANALAVHLNPLQELLQPEGAKDFRGVLAAITHAVRVLPVPIIVKEVGAGISAPVAKQLLDVGVRVIDVAGAGGTSWAGVEILRNKPEEQAKFDAFWDWGIPTTEALLQMQSLRSGYDFTLIASGGIANGLDIAKAVALGADLTGVARPFIKALMERGEEALHQTIQTMLDQLRYTMFLTGSKDLAALKLQELSYS